MDCQEGVAVVPSRAEGLAGAVADVTCVDGAQHCRVQGQLLG